VVFRTWIVTDIGPVYDGTKQYICGSERSQEADIILLEQKHLYTVVLNV